jgi:hypothetical protein
MKLNYRVSVAVAAAVLAASTAWAGDTTPTLDQHKLDAVTVGLSTKSQVRSLLGTPWRIVQFNDCGMAMPGQADETWEYRGRDANGTYRFHVEFDDRGVAHLVARVPDRVPGGLATAAKASAEVMAHNHPM